MKPMPAKGTATCIPCGAVLYKHKPNSLAHTLAFALAGLILFILANSFPFLGLKIGAQFRETTLITGIQELYAQGMQVIAILVDLVHLGSLATIQDGPGALFFGAVVVITIFAGL